MSLSRFKNYAGHGASYIGQLVHETQPPGSCIPSITLWGAHQPKFAREDISFFDTVRYPNWYMRNTDGAKVAPGAAATITASVEFNGVRYPRTFSGVAQGSISDGGDLDADPLLLPVVIPRGSLYYENTYRTCSAGCVYGGGKDLGNGGASERGGAGVVDKTTGSVAYGNSDTSNIYGPIVVAGPTTRPSVLLLSTSRDAGLSLPDASVVFDQGTGITPGEICSSLEPHMGIIRMAVPSFRLSWLLANHPQIFALAQFCSAVVIHMSTNDTAPGGLSMATQQANYYSVLKKQYILGKPVFVTTDGPRQDGVGVNTDAVRVAFNAWKRSVPNGFAGCFDIAPVLAKGDDKTINAFKDGLSTDLIHLNSLAAYNQLRDSKVVNHLLFFDIP